MPSTSKFLQSVMFLTVLVVAACNIERRPFTGPDSARVVKVLVAPDSVLLNPDEGFQFDAFGRTTTGDSVRVPVAWSATAGTVTSSGLYTADSSDSDAIVMASLDANGVTLTSSAQVRKRHVVAIVLTPSSITLPTGATQQLTARGVRNSGDTVSVSVDYSATGGTISESGLFTAGPAAGAYRVIAVYPRRSLADTADVVVTMVPVASLTVTPASDSVPQGATRQLTAVTQDAAGNVLTGRSVSWTSSAPAIATVSATGLVTGVSAGSATITATSEGQSGTSAITVVAPPPPPPPPPLVPVASVTVTPSAASVGVGSTVQLTAVAKDSAGRILSGRSMTWSSSTVQIATVAAGLVTGVSAGTVSIVASSEGKGDTATITVTATAPTPVAAVTVSPSAASVLAGAVVQLTATPKDASGNALAGRSVSWTSGNPAVATVSGAGLVTGVVAGSATITATSEGISGTSAITVVALPPPGTGSCLTQSGPNIVITGAQTSWGNTSMAASTKVDATAAQFAGGANTPVRIGGGAGICYAGGVIIGRLPPSTTWSAMHDTYAMVVKPASALTIENVRIFDYGDGPSMDAQGDAGWAVRGLYLKYMRDDCIENDFLNSGTIDDSFLDGCYDGVSSRDYAGAQDGSGNVLVMRNSLVRLQAMDRAYSGTVPNHNAFWKWSPTIGPKVALYNNVFRADQPSKEGNGAGMYMAPPPGKLADCENNVMVWLGSGPFPETLPTTFNGKPCFRLLTGAEGLQYWNDAAARWRANHPATLVDAGAPIVSLFSPGIVGSTTLTGTVDLIATAVDDQNVAGVQFQLNGQNIGAEVTVESPLTKFTRSWDSRSVPNGTHTLTATARDTAGRTTTAAGVTVTISN